MGREWTPDSIAHALPTPDMRQEFWRQFNLTALPGLKALGEKWVKVIEELEAAVERGRELHADVSELITESRAA
ncbi:MULTISPECIES: hypothetical protein [Streptomyces]|uniref:hypothetical protein n=1 Tax=Streptomyces TaxID=1883 RepID=UPI0004C7632D|nr:hypothetical protein [Streptomyces sp. NRRL S-475]